MMKKNWSMPEIETLGLDATAAGGDRFLKYDLVTYENGEQDIVYGYPGGKGLTDFSS